MTLRQRIEQRITDLRVERDIAAAALTPTWFEACDLRDGDGFGFGVSEYVARFSPATVIARIDRELAGCAVDLALLDWADTLRWDPANGDNPGAVCTMLDGLAVIVNNFVEERYPKEDL
jgi:hypothetical protein